MDAGIEFPNGVIASPDQTLLLVSDTKGRFTYSFQIQPDGKLTDKQEYGHVHLADGERTSGADGMTVDTEGRVYLTSRVGLQIFDQLRPLPSNSHQASERLAFQCGVRRSEAGCALRDLQGQSLPPKSQRRRRPSLETRRQTAAPASVKERQESNFNRGQKGERGA